MKRLAFRPYVLLIAAGAMILASAVGAGQITLLVFGFYGLPVSLAACLFWPSRWTAKHWVFRNAVAVPLALIIAVSVIWTEWPLRGQFLLVRPTLVSLADRLENGEAVRTPLQVGLLRIRKAELNRQGIPCLWTYPDPGGNTGFVRVSADKVESQFNLWSNRTLDQEWQFIAED